MKSEKSSARMEIFGRFLRTLTFEKKNFDPLFKMRKNQQKKMKKKIF